MTGKTELTVIMVCAVIVAAHCVALAVGTVALWVSTWYAGLFPNEQIGPGYTSEAVTISVLAVVAVVVACAYFTVTTAGMRDDQSEDLK